MFNSKELQRLRRERNEALKIVEKLREEEEKHADKFKKLADDNEYLIEKIKQEHSDEMERLKSNQDVVIAKKTEDLKERIASLTVERDTLKNEVSILRKAFENLGFDVKDMKEILNKLVDGVVAKGEIKVIK